ncbi:Cytosolic neutral trehalase [Nakaseomyces bracarensis]|uniref:Endonuclease III homolog n=1 Tax=Nakaseomyces bracarensis TaxID=273131 RepID=A0ABR4NXF8_9SACH
MPDILQCMIKIRSFGAINRSMAILRKRKTLPLKQEAESPYFKKPKKAVIKIENENGVVDRDYVDIDWVKSLKNDEYFKWIVMRNGNVPNRWSQPFDDTIFTDLDDESLQKLPKNFPEMYKKMRWMRGFIRAPVDLIGGSSIPMTVGEMCGIKKTDIQPRNYRLQVLIGVMLSAQTKDEVTAMGMYKIMKYCIEELHDSQGITLESLLRIDEEVLDGLIHSVGFHKRKANFIKRTAKILNEQYGADVPANVTDILGLPGVGPKMGYLTLQKAWGKIEGICVDVHVDRFCKMWNWVDPKKCKNPNDTRKALQEWLPRRLWTEINGLLVGFGQVVGKSRGDFEIFHVNENSEPKQRPITNQTFTTISKLNDSIKSNITSYSKWMKFLMDLDIKLLEKDLTAVLNVSIDDDSTSLKSKNNTTIKTEHTADLVPIKTEPTIDLIPIKQEENISVKLEPENDLVEDSYSTINEIPV